MHSVEETSVYLIMKCCSRPTGKLGKILCTIISSGNQKRCECQDIPHPEGFRHILWSYICSSVLLHARDKDIKVTIEGLKVGRPTCFVIAEAGARNRNPEAFFWSWGSLVYQWELEKKETDGRGKKRAADGPETQTESKFGLGDQSLVGSNHSCALRRNPVRRLTVTTDRKLFVSTT